MSGNSIEEVRATVSAAIGTRIRVTTIRGGLVTTEWACESERIARDIEVAAREFLPRNLISREGSTITIL